MVRIHDSKIVEESEKTRKAREKLKKKLDLLERKITPQALREKVIEIHRWIALHVHERVVLQTKQIALFDENQNTAEVSRKIMLIADQISKDVDLEFKKSLKEDSSIILKKLVQSAESKNLSSGY